MDITERREMQKRLWPNGQNIVDICLRTRMALNGSADPWTEQEIDWNESLLDKVLKTWQPPAGDSRMRWVHEARIDNAVKEIVLATLALINLAKRERMSCL